MDGHSTICRLQSAGMLQTVAFEFLPSCVSSQLHTQESLSCQGFVFFSLSPRASYPQRRYSTRKQPFLWSAAARLWLSVPLVPQGQHLHGFSPQHLSLRPAFSLNEDLCWPGLQGWLTSRLTAAVPCFWVMGVSGLLRRAVLSISGFLAFMHQHKGNLRQSYFIFLLIQDHSPYNPLVL